jgi:hypothetical protein
MRVCACVRVCPSAATFVLLSSGAGLAAASRGDFRPGQIKALNGVDKSRVEIRKVCACDL